MSSGKEAQGQIGPLWRAIFVSGLALADAPSGTGHPVSSTQFSLNHMAQAMATILPRRRFLKVCGASAFAIAATTTGVARAANSANYWLYDFDEETFGEETLLREAVTIAVNRMQEERIWRNTYDVATHSYITGEVMDHSNLNDNRDNRWNLLWHQLYWLSQPNGASDSEPAFPNIHIRAQHDAEGGWLGRANLNLVTVRSSGDEVFQSGEFDITLNRYYLAAGGVYSEPEEWASTLVHEMLHNLGHLHPQGEDALSDAYQINAANNSILCNGYYKHPHYQWRSASHLCGGRV